MGWSIGYDSNWERDVGYGVPAFCDQPKCDKDIDRGLANVCGGDVYGGEYGCGLFFCGEHMYMGRKPRYSDRYIQMCQRCFRYRSPYKPKPEHPEWINHILRDISWRTWCRDNPKKIEALKAQMNKIKKYTGYRDVAYNNIYVNDICETFDKTGKRWVAPIKVSRAKIGDGSIKKIFVFASNWEVQLHSYWTEKDLRVIGNLKSNPKLIKKFHKSIREKYDNIKRNKTK